MTRDQQIEFVKSCLRTSEAALLAKMDRVPENWDGHELRAWITINISRNIGGFDTIPVQTEVRDLRKPRVKAFRNDVLVNNL